MTTNQVRLRVGPDDWDTLGGLGGGIITRQALAAWLKATAQAGANLPLPQASNRLCAAVKRGAVPWGKSVTRHTFVSYHLAQWKSAAATALEAGHTEQMLFNHYREIVTPEVAAAFWAILPTRPSG